MSENSFIFQELFHNCYQKNQAELNSNKKKGKLNFNWYLFNKIQLNWLN